MGWTPAGNGAVERTVIAAVHPLTVQLDPPQKVASEMIPPKWRSRQHKILSANNLKRQSTSAMRAAQRGQSGSCTPLLPLPPHQPAAGVAALCPASTSQQATLRAVIVSTPRWSS